MWVLKALLPFICFSSFLTIALQIVLELLFRIFDRTGLASDRLETSSGRRNRVISRSNSIVRVSIGESIPAAEIVVPSMMSSVLLSLGVQESLRRDSRVRLAVAVGNFKESASGRFLLAVAVTSPSLYYNGSLVITTELAHDKMADQCHQFQVCYLKREIRM